MEFPIDVLYPYYLVKREAGIKVYLTAYFSNLLAL